MAKDATRKMRVTARPGEGVIITEPSLVRVRRAPGSKGCRLMLEIVTADGKVQIVKRDIDYRTAVDDTATS